MQAQDLQGIKAVLFDLDGTLVNTLPGLTQLVNQVRQDFDKPPLNEELVSTYIGKGIPNLIHRALTESMTERLPDDIYKMAMDSLELRIRQGSYDTGTPYPGALDAVKRLKASGYKIALVTNKLYDMTISDVGKTGLLEFMDVVIGGDSTEHPKPAPDPLFMACQKLDVALHETIMVGDSGNDSGAALAAGIKCFLVRTGWSEGISLEEIAKRDNVVDILNTVEDVVNLLISSKTTI